MRKFFRAVAIAMLACCSVPALGADTPFTHDRKVEIVEALNATLLKNYVFPDTAKKIALFLRAKAQRGGYDALASTNDMASALTHDLIEVSGDLHFSVGVDSKWVAEYRAKDAPGAELSRRRKDYEEGAKTNFGFSSAGILDGNIGYINLSYFADPSIAYDTAAAAMRLVENSDAVIIDLRYNNGGYLEMAQFIASYFFSGSKDQLLFDYYYYDDGKRTDRGQWVLPALPGKRMTEKPLYILTGSTSFSAAEWLSYTMKKLGRARIIGARTAGGAHPVDRKPINDDLFLQVPIGQIRDPIDRGDFEGVGVQPDIETPSIDALLIAQKLALEARSKTSAENLADYKWLLPSLMAKIAPTPITPAMLRSVVGDYEGRKIKLDNGRLYYIWRERFTAALTQVAPGIFDIEGVADFRYRLVSKAGRTIGLERVNRDGSTIFYKRL
ncbi:MAG: S41 family peptidase [Sphingomonadales bacterium]